MNKLKKKVFFTIFGLLSLFTITILGIYNYQNYNQEYKSIKNNLRIFNVQRERFDKEREKMIPPRINDNNSRMMVMDRIIYTVKFDDNNNISEITSHNMDIENTDKITNVAKKILNSSNTQKIGNLYTNKYSYKKYKNILIIIDNTKTNQRLINNLEVSLVILILVEIIIVLMSKIITQWIIKPVIKSFNKQKQFVADASHELKTPLAVIMASSEALNNDPKEKKWIENIQIESERMNKLITNLLDLAKLENKDKIVYEEVDLSKIVEKTLLTMDSIMFENNIKLDSNIKDSILYKCNSDEIKQVLLIILDNAVKHCSKDGNIIVNLDKIKDNIIIEIKNTGDPIPVGEEEKIFERFYRIDKARNRNENRYGLGLSIARQIIENYNGTIKAHSNDGYTTFTIKLKRK